jgi:competence protein ComEA
MSVRRWQRPEALALAGLGVALALGVASVIWVNRTPEPAKVSAPEAPAVISVHVAGEVVWPGLYVLKAGSRIQDAIRAAHGPTLVADVKKVNLAAVLRDGDRVVVPRIVQPPYPYAEAKAEERRIAAELRRAGRARSPAAAWPDRSQITDPSPPPAGESAVAVNVNTATAADLERLPGVGPVLARRIVAFREAKGLFRRLQDLREVDGIGPKLYRRIGPLLRLDDGTPGERAP